MFSSSTAVQFCIVISETWIMFNSSLTARCFHSQQPDPVTWLAAKPTALSRRQVYHFLRQQPISNCTPQCQMYYFWLARDGLAAFLQLPSTGCVHVCWEEANRRLQSACGRQFILLSCSHLRHQRVHDWVGFDTTLSPRRLRHQLKR